MYSFISHLFRHLLFVSMLYKRRSPEWNSYWNCFFSFFCGFRLSEIVEDLKKSWKSRGRGRKGGTWDDIAAPVVRQGRKKRCPVPENKNPTFTHSPTYSINQSINQSVNWADHNHQSKQQQPTLMHILHLHQKKLTRLSPKYNASSLSTNNERNENLLSAKNETTAAHITWIL